MRAANHFATITASGGTGKVLVINQAHFLNLSAANALLKTLEEPVPGTYLILATGYASRLLPTIRSRCQRFTLHGDIAAANAWLLQQQSEPGPDQSNAAANHRQQLLFEFGGAPQLAAQAYFEQTQPLGPLLSKALHSPHAAALAPDLLALGRPGADPAELGMRWMRYVTPKLRLPPSGRACRRCKDRGQAGDRSAFGFCGAPTLFQARAVRVFGRAAGGTTDSYWPAIA